MKYRKKRIRLKYKKERVILSDVLPTVMIPFLVKGYEQYVFMHRISMKTPLVSNYTAFATFHRSRQIT